MTDKIKIDFSPIENREFTFQENLIVVRPYLSISEKINIADEYLNLLFGDNAIQ